jgi:vancomycin resistance protein YoaR
MRADPGVSVARDRAYFEQRRLAKARAMRARRRALVVSVAVLLVAVFGAGLGFAGSADRIAAGVSVAGVDLGGMTASEARAALESRAAAVAGEPVVFVAGDRRFSVTPEQAGVEGDWDGAVGRALDAGDGFAVFRGLKRIALRIAGTDVAPVAAGDAAVAAEVERLAGEIDRPARNASLVLESLTPVVRPARPGTVLDRPRAEDLVGSALAGFARGEPVTLPIRVDEPTVRQPDLGEAARQVRTMLSGDVALVYRKKTFTVEPAELAELLVLPKNGRTEVAIGGRDAARYFAGLADELDRKPADAGFALTPGGKPKVVPAKEGRKLEVGAARSALLAASLAATPADRRAELTVATAQPERTTAEAKRMGIVGVVGAYTTVYGGDPNRVHNVQLVANLIDDHLIAPGEVFSFNQTTGERNADKGFLEAPVIINGELQTGLGGGVCQVSTTVFNAAFEAGLSIEERTNHALYISHYPTGRDATVNFPDLDLKFTNDTGRWLWLRAFVGSSELTVVLYGTPADRRVEIETSPLEVTGPPPVERIADDSMFRGERAVEESGQPSRAVSVRRIVYGPDGEVLYDTVWHSSYVAEPRIVRYGTKPVPVEDEPAAPSSGEPSEDPASGGAGAGSGSGGSGAGGGSTGGSAGGSAGGSTGSAPTGEPPAPPA